MTALLSCSCDCFNNCFMLYHVRQIHRWQDCSGRCRRVPVSWEQANIWQKESYRCNVAYWFSFGSHELLEEDLEQPTAQYQCESPRLSRTCNVYPLRVTDMDAAIHVAVAVSEGWKLSRYPVQAEGVTVWSCRPTQSRCSCTPSPIDADGPYHWSEAITVGSYHIRAPPLHRVWATRSSLHPMRLSNIIVDTSNNK